MCRNRVWFKLGMNDKLKEEARLEILNGIQYEKREQFEYGMEDTETVLLDASAFYKSKKCLDSLILFWFRIRQGEKTSLQSTGERAEKKGKQIHKNKQINT